MRGFLITILLFLTPAMGTAQSVATLFVPERAEAHRNPALLLVDEQRSFVVVSPSFASVSGNLRLPYDPASFDSYQVTSDMVRVLGSKGTFHGSASYAYQQRRNVWSSLRLDPYRGDGFFAVDTILGDIRYSGPAVQFEYAYQLFPDLAIGFLGSYRVLDGLKDRFTNALTDFRAIRFGAGVEYQLSANDRLGLTVIGTDDQEKIESKSSDDLKDVEVFSFRGETYATRRRSMTLSEVFRMKGFESTIDFSIKPSAVWEFSGEAHFSLIGFRSLFPSGLLVEFEDGFAQQKSYGGVVTAGCQLSDDVTLRLHLMADYRDSWSRISSRQLLFWEWNAAQNNATIELLYRLGENSQIRAALTAGTLAADSSKYIDVRSGSIRCGRYGGDIGYETKFSEILSASFGALLRSSKFDPLMGGEEIRVVDLSASVSYSITPQVNLTLSCFGGAVSGNVRGASEGRTRRGVCIGVKIL